MSLSPTPAAVSVYRRDIAGPETSVLSPDDTLRHAMACMRAASSGAALVVAEDGALVGMVADSDIRRAAVTGTGLDVAVAHILPEEPLVADTTYSEEETLELLRSHRVRCVPLVDGAALAGTCSLAGFPDPGNPPTAIVMAGGRGQRLRPFTDRVPKPLLRIGSSSILERIIRSLASAGVQDVAVAVNYKAELFEQRLGTGAHLGVRLHYLYEDEPMGTAGALGLLPTDLAGPILVTNGDIVTTLDFTRLLDFHWRHRGAVTVSGVEHRSAIPYGVLHTAEHHLLDIEEKPERRDLCSAGIYVVEPEVLRMMPSRRPLDMPELVAGLLAQGQPVHVFPVLEKWFDIGGTAEFERVLVEFALGEDE
jgi:dTDP-glucose pyrophosphorylase